MEAMRDGWNDDRLDEFAAQTDRRFDRLERRMETGFAEIRKEMDIRFDKVDARFDKVDERFDKVDERFERLDARIDALNHTLNRAMLQFGTGLIVTIALGFAGLIVAH
jgi:vacuolar-type H+-ATPase subunit I/STV1